MRKIYALILLSLVLSTAAAQELDIKTGLGLEFYGFRGEDETLSVDSRYTSVGLDLGIIFGTDGPWEFNGGLFLGLPQSAAVYVDGDLFSEPDLGQYDLYSYFINLTLGGAYRFEWDRLSLILGPVLNFNDFVLASHEREPGYVLSYTFGLGAACRMEFQLKRTVLYAGLKGSGNFFEMLVIHDDFAYAYEAGLSLGLVWRVE